jgi:hypothetical protein
MSKYRVSRAARVWNRLPRGPRGWCAAALLCMAGLPPLQAVAQGAGLPQCAALIAVSRWNNCVGTWADPAGGWVYSGEFRNGVYHGFGTLQVGQVRYAGEFRDGRMHGQGVMALADGTRYVGAVADGTITGI